MGGFNGYPLAVGTVTGVRVWNADPLGRLCGVSYPQVWTPGENHAVCMAQPAKATAPSDPNKVPQALTVGMMPTPNPIHVRNEIHPDCSCGFWAYHSHDAAKDRGNIWGVPGRRVTGIIEGYGRTTIGTEGFRAGKARIVALALDETPPAPPGEPAEDEPTPKQRRRLALHRFNAWWNLAWALWSAAWSVASLINGAIGWAVLWASFAVLFVGLLVWNRRMRRRHEKHMARARALVRQFQARALNSGWQASSVGWHRVPTDEPAPAPLSAHLADAVRANYPEVLIYNTVAEMLEAHPIDPPPRPSPADPGR